MEFSQVLRRRRMVRRFAKRPIGPEVLDQVLAAALRAPSAGFTQGVDLLVLESPEQRRAFWKLATAPEWRARSPLAGELLAAPIVVLPIVDPDAYVARYNEADKTGSALARLGVDDWPVPYWLVDTSFTAMLVLLAATDSGLGALFFHLHRPEGELLEGLGVPAGRRTIGAIVLGYPGDADSSTSPSRRRRRTFEEVVHYDSW